MQEPTVINWNENFGEIVIFSGQPETDFSSFSLNPIPMNVHFRKFLSVAASTILAAFSVGSASGQAAKVEGGKPQFDDLPSPEFNGGKQKNFRPKDWLEIEASLKVSLRPEPKSKTCDKITVKWYIAVKNPEKAGTFLLLTKDIDYVNIPLDEIVFTSIYLSPASMRTITGSDKGGKQAVELVGYEVLVNGVKAVEETNKGKVGWWNTVSTSISRSDSPPLLDKIETPFADMWWDRYAEVSRERR